VGVGLWRFGWRNVLLLGRGIEGEVLGCLGVVRIIGTMLLLRVLVIWNPSSSLGTYSTALLFLEKGPGWEISCAPMFLIPCIRTRTCHQ